MSGEAALSRVDSLQAAAHLKGSDDSSFCASADRESRSTQTERRRECEKHSRRTVWRGSVILTFAVLYALSRESRLATKLVLSQVLIRNVAKVARQAVSQ